MLGFNNRQLIDKRLYNTDINITVLTLISFIVKVLISCYHILFQKETDYLLVPILGYVSQGIEFDCIFMIMV